MEEQEKQQEKTTPSEIISEEKKTKVVETNNKNVVENKPKKEDKEEIKETKTKRTDATVNATDLPISTKHAIAVCNFIRNMNIDKALKKLELAEKMKIPVPMRGEIPHRKGIMSGRYPVSALGHFIKVIKSLKSNALVNELELEKYKIFCKANVASRPYRRFGKGRFKRTHVQVKLIPITKKQTKKTK